MSLKKVATYLLIAFLVFFLIQEPAEAAKIVKATGENAGDLFSTTAEAFTDFLKSLF